VFGEDDADGGSGCGSFLTAPDTLKVAEAAPESVGCGDAGTAPCPTPTVAWCGSFLTAPYTFKVAEVAPEGGALEQIKVREDAEEPRSEGLPIQRIGIAFSRERRHHETRPRVDSRWGTRP
jgi:hypothetical protein